MIDRLRGVLVDKQVAQICVEVGGVTFSLAAPLTTVEKCGPVGGHVCLFVHLVVKEDALELYGFHDDDSRQLFRRLLKVNNVGPKTALTVLSRFGIKDFIQLVRDGDIKRLSSGPGIGRKTAERIILELRDKFGGGSAADGLAPEGGLSPAGEAVRALVSLGFTTGQADEAVRAARRKLGDEVGTEELIRQALRG